MKSRKLAVQQMDNKIRVFGKLSMHSIPDKGWVKAIRTTLGMSLQQLANRLAVTKQAVLDMERRESDGGITIKSLKEIGDAMDMQLVYGFVPKDGSLDELIERRAKALATEIVLRTSNSMRLEDQSNSELRIRQAISEMSKELKKDMPKMLWD